ncbi:MAG: hypothetical protein ACMXX9_04205 [Candidatus Woesearchaeota archaeon]
MGFEEIKTKIDINRSLLAVTFTIFVLIITLDANLLKENIYLTIQLPATIPLLIVSIFSRSKVSGSRKPHLWEGLSYIGFIVGYSFLINIIGIILFDKVSMLASTIFFLINIITEAIYSAISILDGTDIKKRLLKDIIFFSIIFFGGIIPLF